MANANAALKQPLSAELHADEFSSLLQKEFKPKTDEARDAVASAVRTLAEQALSNSLTIGSDAYQAIEAIIAEIDRKLSEQVNAIIHHADFQQLESAWRGLHYLVNNTEVVLFWNMAGELDVVVSPPVTEPVDYSQVRTTRARKAL